MLTIAGGIVLAAVVLFFAWSLIQADQIGTAVVLVALFLAVAAFYVPISDFVGAIIRGRSISN